jgi:hypothetical protein
MSHLDILGQLDNREAEPKVCSDDQNQEHCLGGQNMKGQLLMWVQWFEASQPLLTESPGQLMTSKCTSDAGVLTRSMQACRLDRQHVRCAGHGSMHVIPDESVPRAL